jgi:hypothetical protein
MQRLMDTVIPKWKALGLIDEVIVTQSNLNDSVQIQQMRQPHQNGVVDQPWRVAGGAGRLRQAGQGLIELGDRPGATAAQPQEAMEAIKEFRPGALEAMAAQIAAGWILQTRKAAGDDEGGGDAFEHLLEAEQGAVQEGGHRSEGLQLVADGSGVGGGGKGCRAGVMAQDGAGLALGGGEDRSLRGGEIHRDRVGLGGRGSGKGGGACHRSRDGRQEGVGRGRMGPRALW